MKTKYTRVDLMQALHDNEDAWLEYINCIDIERANPCDETRKATDMARLIESVSFFASTGGTAFDNTLFDAMDLIRTEKGGLKDADIVLVTDGGARVSDEWANDWHRQRTENGVRCYSILVGNQTYAATCRRISDECTFVADAMKEDEAMHHLFGAV